MGKTNYFERRYKVPFNLPIFAYVLWRFSEACNRREFSYKEIIHILKEVEEKSKISIEGIFNYYTKLSDVSYENPSYVSYLLHVFGGIYGLIDYIYKDHTGRKAYIYYISIIIKNPKGLEELAKEAESKYNNNLGFLKLKEGLDRVLSETPGCKTK